MTDPARDVGEGSRVAVDGRPLEGPEPRVLYAVNKPVGVVSTARDTHGRPTVIELVPARGLRLYPVGRLDADSSGLILLTNDGELANRLTHPSFQVPKTYRAKLGGGPVGEGALSALRGGVDLDDGPTAPARVRRVNGNLIELTIHEGRNRQVRRMCEAVGHPVRRAAAHRLWPAAAGRSGARGAQTTERGRGRAAPRALTESPWCYATLRPARRHQRESQRRPGHPGRDHRADEGDHGAQRARARRTS